MNTKKRKNKPRVTRPKNRTETVLGIIRTDSTFNLHTFRDGSEVWVGKCIHCNARLTISKCGETAFTIEHIVPLYASGTNDLDNLALACGGCNNEKGLRHDKHVGKGGRADEVVKSLKEKRLERWCDKP